MKDNEVEKMPNSDEIISESERIKEEKIVNLIVEIIVRLTLKECYEEAGDTVPEI